MTYRHANYIITHGTRSEERAAEAIKLASKCLRVAAILQELKEAAVMLIKYALFYGGTTVAVIGFACLGGELPPDYTGNMFIPYLQALAVFVVGVGVAYIGDKLLERSGNNEKRK